MLQLDLDYQYCEEVMKKHSKSFYFAFSKLKKEKAKAIYAVYAFCRIVDDSVDEVTDVDLQKERLKKLAEDLKAFETGQEKDHPIWRALRDVFNRYEMNIDPFYLQIEGQVADTNFEQPKTIEDLERYSYLVAGSVGLMLLPILATKHAERLESSAIDLGVAMQFTNVLRDIGEDWKELNRIYIPEALVETSEYTYNDLKTLTVNKAFVDLWESLAVQAEEKYERFTQSVHLFDSDCSKQVLLAANIYRGILDAVRNNDYDCLTKRNYVTASQKNKILFETRKQFKEITDEV